MLTINIGVQVKFDGRGFLEVEIPKAYYGRVRKTPASLCKGISLQGRWRGGAGAPFSLEWEGGANEKCPLPPPALKIPSISSAHPDLRRVRELQRRGRRRAHDAQ